MRGQISIDDYLESIGMAREPDAGEYVEKHGAVICHIMRPSYIGKKVVYDCSTESHVWYRAGILEDYIPDGKYMRSIIYVGKPQRILLTHYPGREIYEPHTWKWDERLKLRKEN